MAAAWWWPFRKKPPLYVAIDRGKGQPVLLLHGIASSSVTYDNVVDELVDRHRVVAMDLLGFGGSSAPADAQFTLNEHVDSGSGVHSTGGYSGHH